MGTNSGSEMAAVHETPCAIQSLNSNSMYNFIHLMHKHIGPTEYMKLTEGWRKPPSEKVYSSTL
jgi:hypothetical protein